MNVYCKGHKEQNLKIAEVIKSMAFLIPAGMACFIDLFAESSTGAGKDFRESLAWWPIQ